MWKDWIYTNWNEIALAALCTVAFYAAVIIYARIAGLRSFSKMSAFDFAMTIALGSLFASTIASPKPPLLLGLASLAFLFLGQKIIAVARGSDLIKHALDNDPLLLMANGQMLRDNMQKANVTVDDLHAKLREANVLDYNEVKAVVFETTGDVSVLSGGSEKQLNPALLKGVRAVDGHF